MHLAEGRVCAGHLVGEQDPGRHPRQHHDEQGQQLQVPSKHTRPLFKVHDEQGQQL